MQMQKVWTLDDVKADWLRVQSDFTYVRTLMAAKIYLNALRREQRFNPYHDEAGRFTTADGAVSGSFGSDSLTGGSGNDAADDTLSGGDANGRMLSGSEFSPSGLFWHQYAAGPNVACAAELNCTREEMVDQIRRFSVPGLDPSIPAEDGKIYDVYDPRTGMYAGKVRVSISPDGLTITNRTQPGHLLYDGQIVRQAVRAADGSWTITTHGTGNNFLPLMNLNNAQDGPKIFDVLDQRLRDNIERFHGFRKSVGEVDTGGSGHSAVHHNSWSDVGEI